MPPDEQRHLGDGEDDDEAKEDERIDGVSVARIPVLARDSGDRQNENDVRRDQIAEVLFEDEVVEDPPRDDLQREYAQGDAARHALARPRAVGEHDGEVEHGRHGPPHCEHRQAILNDETNDPDIPTREVGCFSCREGGAPGGRGGCKQTTELIKATQ